ncbi:hypothetical protein PV379_00905 [Streptomyces caniscabiei]|uniref:hypothetical protein n=1 Tax=Streptomyces caniscabiei TaxID=2746961 RepID=UPI00299FB856|nr:hypothetical protein [Streptomyces caniscabiei]MDX2775914.1 hypothetical protein [Streptomyces caniscabiei]
MDEERDQQTTEVRQTSVQQGDTNVQRQQITTSTKADSRLVARRIVYYVLGVVVTFLLLRMVLLLLAANQGSWFVDFVYAVGGFFAAPFFGVFSYEPVYGQSVFEVSSLVAIIVYSLLALGIAKLFTLTKTNDASV